MVARRILATLCLTLSLLVPNSRVQAASALVVNPIPTAVVKGQQLVITGTATTQANQKVTLYYKTNGRWKKLATTPPRSNGKWSVLVKVPASTFVIRAVRGSQKSKIQTAKVMKPKSLPLAGPGKRIWGTDISRWQHSSNQIDFAQMKRAGASFVFIKASDGLSSEDSLARPLALADSTAAKSAGLYVGYYHRARLPVTNDQETLRADAISQARLVQSRLTELGGYRGGQVLPYVLDIEGVDTQINSESVTLWTATWVEEVVRQTKRRPIIYSYRSFLASRYRTDATTTTLLRSSHLWLAHPGNPADSQVVPGHFNSGAGCYQTAWTKKDCSAVWTFWQYTASGDRDVFGIPWSPKSGNCPAGANYCFAGTGTGNKHLDLNVFSGTAADMAALANGTWKRTAFDY